MADERPTSILGMPIKWVGSLPGDDVVPVYRAPCAHCGWPTCSGQCMTVEAYVEPRNPDGTPAEMVGVQFGYRYDPATGNAVMLVDGEEVGWIHSSVMDTVPDAVGKGGHAEG